MYQSWLSALKMSYSETLRYLRLHRDMIEVYKN